MPSASKSQQRLFGMVHAYQKGELGHVPDKVREIAEHISSEDARHFAETRHTGLPERKRRKKGDGARKSAAYIAGFLSKCAEHGGPQGDRQMTLYEQGFLSKCAEHGIGAGGALRLLKLAGKVTLGGGYSPNRTISQAAGVDGRSWVRAHAPARPTTPARPVQPIRPPGPPAPVTPPKPAAPAKPPAPPSPPKTTRLPSGVATSPTPVPASGLKPGQTAISPEMAAAMGAGPAGAR